MLASVADWQGGMLEFRYDRGRRPSEIARQNGVTTRYTYDGDGRIATIEESRDGVLASLSLTRDAAGRIVSAERNLPVALELEAGGQTYVYDAANQLEGATYDGLGRMVADGTRSFVWDAASRLASVKTPEGTTNYTYDGLGLLVGRGEETFVRNYALGLGSISVVR
jgi:YD repeat-containing protein